MNGILAYFLLYMGTALFCSFDSAVKDRLEVTEKNSSRTKPPSNFSVKSTRAIPVIDFKCEALGCVSRNLKLFNEKAEMIEDGWISGMELLTGYNSTMTNSFKQVLNKCIPEVNKRLSSPIIISGCGKYQWGFFLLDQCASKIKKWI